MRWAGCASTLFVAGNVLENCSRTKHENFEEIWRILCRFSFWQPKNTPSSAWSSLREGADLEMLLVFEGSDGMEKWLSHRARHRVNSLQPLTVHPWNYALPCQAAKPSLYSRASFLSLGGRRYIWTCAKKKYCLDMSNSINPVKNCDCGWKTMGVIWGPLGGKNLLLADPNRLYHKASPKRRKSSRVQQNIANCFLKFEETDKPKKRTKNPRISNIPSWITMALRGSRHSFSSHPW